MVANVLNMFRVEDLRIKVLFTLSMIFVYRLGCFVPAPGIDIDAIQLLKETTDENGGALAFLRLFSGGALTQFAIFALGIMPYITASIIMQILGLGNVLIIIGTGMKKVLRVIGWTILKGA